MVDELGRRFMDGPDRGPMERRFDEADPFGLRQVETPAAARERGIAAVIALHARARVELSREEAEHRWDRMTSHQRAEVYRYLEEP